MIDERCDNCKFFKIAYEFKDEPPLDVFMKLDIQNHGYTHPDDRTGECLRFPPVLLIDWVIDSIKSGTFDDSGSESREYLWGRPLTKCSGYCGEFKEQVK